MPTFEYIALDNSGKQSRGSIVAESPVAARQQLRNRNLHATRLRPVSEISVSGGHGMRLLFGGRRRREVLEFTRQLATMLQADVQLTEALGVLIAQTSDEKFAQILQNIRDQILAGESFVEGLRQYPDWFDNIYLAMIRVGEATGNTGRSLELLANYMGKKQKVESKVKSALTYPVVLVVVCVIVIIVLMTFVVPRITQILIQSGKQLPGMTVFLMGISDFMVNYWWLLLLLLGVAVFLFRRMLASQRGRLIFDNFMLHLPVLGVLMRQNIVARFTSTLAALIRSGLPMADSLQVVAGVTGNAVMDQAVKKARERIIAGADIATPLRDSKVVGPAVAHMISVGERTGELEHMLLTIADSMEENTDATVQRISALIEPIIIVIMAVVVGFIMMSVLLPILQMSDITK